MKNLHRRLSGWLLLTLATLWLGTAAADVASDAARLDKIFPRTSLKIATADSRQHSFNVWLASDEQRRQLGLMFVKHMDDNTGMLFVYREPFQIGMWMKDTFLSLDLLFVDAQGKIVQIIERTTPQSTDVLQASSDALGVIELNAGMAAKLRIRPGAQVLHPAFKVPAPAK